jgi:hypothetical protein
VSATGSCRCASAPNSSFPMFRTNALYEGAYLLGTSIARPLITKRQIAIAKGKRGEAPFSVDTNLLHISAKGKALDVPWIEHEKIRLQPHRRPRGCARCANMSRSETTDAATPGAWRWPSRAQWRRRTALVGCAALHPPYGYYQRRYTPPLQPTSGSAEDRQLRGSRPVAVRG